MIDKAAIINVPHIALRTTFNSCAVAFPISISLTKYLMAICSRPTTRKTMLYSIHCVTHTTTNPLTLTSREPTRFVFSTHQTSSHAPAEQASSPVGVRVSSTSNSSNLSQLILGIFWAIAVYSCSDTSR